MAALDRNVVVRLARCARQAGEWYLFARVVPVLGTAAPEQGEWQIGYLQALAHLGLNSAAIEFIGRLPAAVRGEPAVAALVDRVRGGKPSLVPWTSRRRRFEANLAALSALHPQQTDLVRDAAAELASRWQLHLTSDGNHEVKEVGAAWPPVWLPSLDDHRAAAGARFDFPIEGVFPPAMMFDGVGLGWEILEGYRRSKNVFLQSSSAMYVLERDPRAVAIVFHVHDWREVLGDPRVLWFIGPHAGGAMRERMEAETGRPIAERYFALPLIRPDGVGGAHPTPGRSDMVGEAHPTPATSIMAAVGAARVQAAAGVREQITEAYVGRDAAWWARRFAGAVDERGRARGEPLRILGLTSRHTTFLQYSMRDCLRALDRLGHRTRLIIEPDDCRQLDAESLLRQQLDFQPDLVLLLSRMRYESAEAVHAAVPSVTWDQDALPWVFDPRNSPMLAWNDFLMGFAARHAPQRFGWAQHRCRFCPMAGSIDSYSADPLPETELAPLRCDVSYVSHASAPPEQEIGHVERWLADDRLIPVFHECLRTLLPDWMNGGEFPGPVAVTIRGTAGAMRVTLTRVEHEKLVQAVQRIGDRAFRHVALGWVADWAERTGRTLHLWGNGWERHPRLARHARGPTKNGHELRCVYQASRINLQLIGFGFLHQRALDGLMAGAFFMTRRLRWDTCGAEVRRAVALLEEHGIDGGGALQALPRSTLRTRIEEALDAIAFPHHGFEVQDVANLRHKASGDFAGEIVPHFAEISFSGPEEFARQAERFLACGELRGRYATAMRAALVERYSYDSRMSEMLRFVRDGFDMEANTAGARRRQLGQREEEPQSAQR